MPSKPITLAVVGAGHRSIGYMRHAYKQDENVKLVAIADPDPVRRQKMAQEYGIAPEMQFASYQELAARPRVADAIINGTMDAMHYESSIPLLERGYHMLLEKPIAPSEQEVRSLIDTAQKNGVTVMICHVLRYAPFYVAIKDLASGTIGDIVALHTAENVSYHHMAVAFIRGRWNNEATSNPMMLAKCCHDLDIIAWLFSGNPAKSVSSLGSLMQFKPANAPAGSALRCLDGCQIESTCAYSARTNYITQGLWGAYAWETLEGVENLTLEQKLESLRTDNPYGRCVWHCDNNVVDHQSVMIEFANGATATHDMFCATSRPCRTIHILGTKGEIEGNMEEGKLVVRHPLLELGKGYQEEVINLDVKSDGHGGGDQRLVSDFIHVLRGESASSGVTRIEDSLTGHLIAFAAHQAMSERRVVDIA